MVTVFQKNSFLTIVIIISCISQQTIQAIISSSKESSTFYTAGVVEFQPAQFTQPEWTPLQQLEDNLKDYIRILQSQEANETDIIVFPEMTLNTNDESSFVPDPTIEHEAPCDNPTNNNGDKYHDFLIQISCQTKNLTKYVVINIVEKDRCLSINDDPRPCASTGLNLFNTNVVFDRNGVVISRYRKIHLWGEPRNVTFKPELGYFDTDFGVRFGHFVCFDLLFYMPAQEMVNKMGIKDFIFPTMWFSQLPFLTGVQIQSAWSYANDVNFLAAGASFPAVGTTGSGIYAGRRGALQAIMTQTKGQRKLLVSRLDKFQKRSKRSLPLKKETKTQMNRNNDDIYLKQDSLEHYESILLNLNESKSFKNHICQRNLNLNTQFCCYFELDWSELKNDSLSKPYYNYRLGVFNGLRKEAAPESNLLRNCALFACTGSNITDCGKILADTEKTNIIFNNLIIEAQFPNATELLIMPNSLQENLLPIAVRDFQWTETIKGSTRFVRFELLKPVTNLLTFSIYGNYYDSNDAVDEPISCDNNGINDSSTFCDDDSARSNICSLLLLVVCSIFSKFAWHWL